MKLVAGDRMTLAAMVNDRGALEEWVRATVLGNWHACGTCRMGAANDPHAVVDPQGAVYGVEGLHVADASVMPEIICGNTHLTTVMVAEKMSDALARPSRAAATPELQVLPAPALGAA